MQRKCSEILNNMKKLAFIVALLGLCVCAHAETVLLRTGARVEGTIVFQNDEVVILRNAEGARFQYPKSDVAEIFADDAVVPEAKAAEGNDAPEIKTSKKASILLEIAGGAACIPGQKMGAAVSADLLVGSHHIGDKHIFVGGGVGYHGSFMGADKYNFLPIQAAIRMPFTETKHAPVFGLGLGYGIALSKNYVGGLYAGVDLGYRYQLNPKTALGAVFYTQFQQAKMNVTETVEETEFVNNTGRNLISFGAKFTLYF